MNAYFYHLNYYHPRTDKKTATVVGVVFAENQEQAEELAWKKSGRDSAAQFEVWPVGEEGESYYVPR